MNIRKWEFITEEEIESINDEYYEGRYRYLREVINQIKLLDNINTTLELGPYKSPLIKGGDIVDITESYLKDYPIEIGNFYKHDCSITPYPFEDKKYDLIIACQVLEHLGRNQHEVFKEFARIGKMAIITLPYKWDIPCDVHHMIDEKIIDRWAGGLKPVFQHIIENRILRIYNFDEHHRSLENIKNLQKHANFQVTEQLNEEKNKRETLEKQLKQIQNQLEKSNQIIQKNQTQIQETGNQLKSFQELIQQKENQVKQTVNLLSTSDQEIKEKNILIKTIEQQLTTFFYEMEYLNNTHRSIFQRFISRFPSLYILFKTPGIKNAGINIKGFKAIKKNNLFDIGYYLKNNNDVRLSGMDPILHYMYYGFKEGRKPNSSFDAGYYLKIYGDIKRAKLNPLVHYSLYGIAEGRKTIKTPPKSNKQGRKKANYNKKLKTISKLEIKPENKVKERINHKSSSKKKDKFNQNMVDFLNSKMLSYECGRLYPQNLHKNPFSKSHRIYRIAVFIKGKNGKYRPSSYVRLLLALYHPLLYGRIVPLIITDEDLKHLDKDYLFKQQFDCVIVQRDVLNKDFSKYLVEKCKELDIKLIYEIDDDLLGIDESHPEYNFYISRTDTIRYLIENADLVTVSTDELRRRLLIYNNIKTIPNVLDEQLWFGLESSDNKSDQTSDTVKIGYIGSSTHDADIMIIKEAILNLKKKCALINKKVKFYIIGGFKNSVNADWMEVIKIPSDKKDYPNFVKWLKETVDWDIAVAPLRDTNINRCKSELKYLEYSALGLPCVYSDIGPYNKVIKNEYNGLLVKVNTAENWENEISKLIENRTLYNTIITNAEKDIKENYLLKNIAGIWDDLLYDLIEGKPKK